MKRNIYKLNNIDCAACASKIEDGVNKLDGVIESNLNYILLKFFVTYDENLISDEEIEKQIHKSLSGVQIVQKNNEEFQDNYQEQNIFQKILFKKRHK